MTQSKNLKLFFVSFALLAIFFLLYPKFDLVVSSLFFSKELGEFPMNYKYDPIMGVINTSILSIIYLWIVVIMIFMKKIYFTDNNLFNAIKEFNIKKIWKELFITDARRKLTYIIIFSLIGPLCAVRAAKYTFERVRPKSVQEFGGKEEFSGAWRINKVSKNYHHSFSFVSGHAATGFMIGGLAFIYPAGNYRRRRWLIAGVAAGSLFGFVRISQGEHFLSDVIFSGYVVYSSALLAAYKCKLL